MSFTWLAVTTFLYVVAISNSQEIQRRNQFLGPVVDTVQHIGQRVPWLDNSGQGPPYDPRDSRYQPTQGHPEDASIGFGVPQKPLCLSADRIFAALELLSHGPKEYTDQFLSNLRRLGIGIPLGNNDQFPERYTDQLPLSLANLYPLSQGPDVYDDQIRKYLLGLGIEIPPEDIDQLYPRSQDPNGYTDRLPLSLAHLYPQSEEPDVYDDPRLLNLYKIPIGAPTENYDQLPENLYPRGQVPGGYTSRLPLSLANLYPQSQEPDVYNDPLLLNLFKVPSENYDQLPENLYPGSQEPEKYYTDQLPLSLAGVYGLHEEPNGVNDQLEPIWDGHAWVANPLVGKRKWCFYY